MIFFIALIVVVVIIALWFVGVHNSMISLVEKVSNAKSQISVQIESRWDALTSLIKATKKYSEYESATIENIIHARTKVTGKSDVEELNESENQFQRAFGGLMAIVERYPELKADKTYTQTMEAVNKYEDNVRYARMTFNDTVTMYNRKIKSIPTNVIAGMMGLKEENYFEGSSNKQDMPMW